MTHTVSFKKKYVRDDGSLSNVSLTVFFAFSFVAYVPLALAKLLFELEKLLIELTNKLKGKRSTVIRLPK